MKITPILAYKIIIALILLLAGGILRADPSEATITAPSGSIVVATNQSISFNATSTDSVGYDIYTINSFTWTFNGGSPVTGNPVAHTFTTAGTYTVTLTVSYTGKTCTRTDINGNCTSYSSMTKTATATRTITVIDSPIIDNFSASSISVRAGSSVNLNWSTRNATSLSITGVGAVTGSTVSVYPGSPSTTYTLTASNAVGSKTAQVTVNTYTVAVTINPTTASILFGGTQTFTAGATPANQGVTWSTTGGSVNAGTYSGTSSGSFDVIATSLEDTSKSASAHVTVASVAVGTPSPANSSVNAGSTLQYSAVVSGAVNAGVTWSVSGGGTISPTGLFTATTAGSYTVTAQSIADTSKKTSTPVIVNSVVTGITISPTTASLKAGEAITFTASVSGQGGNNPAVTWSATGGSINSTGVYTAPLTAGPYSVTATSVQDSSKKASSSVSVASIVVSTPAPAGGAVDAGNTLQFSSSVSGAANPAITWSVTGGGTINSSGLFSATSAGSFTVTAKSAADPTKSASTSVTVNPVVSGMTLTAPKTALNAGESVQLTATVSNVGGGSTAVTWSATSGSIVSNGNGIYTAPLPTSATSVTVTATSVQNPSVVRSINLTVAAASVGVPSPANSSVNAGSTLQFASSVSGAANTGIIWSVSGGGTITAAGLFSATTAGTFTVTATSLADSTKKASTTVYVHAVVSGISVTPTSATLKPGDTLKFSASVTGVGIVNYGVTWSSSAGSIGSDGTFTAPNQSGPVVITAVSQQDSTKSGAVTITLKGWVLVWKKDILYMGAKEIAEVDSQGLHVTLVDHLGSPRFLAGPTGALESTQKFLPFGESLTDPTSAAKFAKGFTNHEQTDASGLVYMQARFYAPWYGRFLSPDPARDQHFEATQSWNIYSYVMNSPTMMTDPTGMYIPWESWQKNIAVAGAFLKGVVKQAAHDVVGLVRMSASNPHQAAIQQSTSLAIATVQAGGIKPLVSQKIGEAKAAWSGASAEQKAEWIGRGTFEAALLASPFLGKAGAAGTLGSVEARTISEAGSILRSPGFAQLEAAHAAGEPASVLIGGRTIQYEPGFAASGLTNFEGNGFVMGRGAFSSPVEAQKTVLHELYRLNTSQSAAGLSGELAAKETAAAHSFADRAHPELEKR